MTQTSAFHFESLVWDWPIAIYLFLIGISAVSYTNLRFIYFCAVSRLLAAFAAACQPGGDDPDAGADCLSHSASAMGSSRGALAIGRNVACLLYTSRCV